MSVQRKRYGAEEKTRVAIKGQKTRNSLAAEYGVHPGQITPWKKQAREEISAGFSGGRALDNIFVERVRRWAYILLVGGFQLH